MQRALLPSADFFVPDSVKDRRFAKRVLRAASRAQGTVHLSHAACLDGAACDAIVRLARGDVAVETVFVEPHETIAALRLAAGVPGRAREIALSDLSFQKGQGADALAALRLARDNGWRVAWRDHHAKQWEGAPLEAMAEVADLTVDFAGKECGATLVAAALAPSDAFARELATVVRDHDLWILADPRSVRLQEAAYHAGSERFVARVLASRSIDDPELARWSGEAQREKRELVEGALAHARLERGERAVVGVAYGRVPTNEVLHALGEKGAHLSVLFKPDGGFSLRSMKHVPVCHLVAQRYRGGGHPNASGGRIDVPAIELPVYWARRGDAPAARALVADALREVEAFLAAGPPSKD